MKKTRMRRVVEVPAKREGGGNSFPAASAETIQGEQVALAHFFASVFSESAIPLIRDGVLLI
jgi:hypothetical protein